MNRSSCAPPPVVKQERHSHIPESNAQRVAHNTSPTSQDYSGLPKREVVYASMSWTDCFDDGCQIHHGEKHRSGWYPQFTRRSRNLVSPRTTTGDKRWKRTQERTGPHNEQPRQRRARQAHGDITSWEHCFNDNGNEHLWEKVHAGYYDRRVGEKGTLSKHIRREHKKRRAVRARLEREGSKKRIPDVAALERTISHLRSQLDCAARIIVAKDNDLERLDEEKGKLQQAYNRVKPRMRQIGATLWTGGV